ncbi:ATP-binding protein [Arthrobacter sp. 3Tela_A]|uniref:ATP-binding protein n=1 Tax=Arthrobacter sp. 3Tela_A TaxID=3093743 RepID=UPI003BB5CE7B
MDSLLDRLHAVNVRAVDLTEAQLMLSRADQKTFTSEPVDLSLLLDEAAETLLPLAEKRRVSLHTYGGVADAVGSRALLRQLTTNLLHNAIIHNLPEDGRVWARTEVGQWSIELIVGNTGETLAPDLISTLTEPFQRGTDRVRSGLVGAGLGLAILKNIVQAHDGILTIAGRPAGGIRVSAVLPAGVGG